MLKTKKVHEYISILVIAMFISVAAMPSIVAGSESELSEQICVETCDIETAPLPQGNTSVDTYGNSKVLIVGTCESVKNLGLWWIFGLYYPILPRQITVTADNQPGEILFAYIFGENDHGFYMFESEIQFKMYGAKGLFFWGGKSKFINSTDPPLVFVYANVRSVTVTEGVIEES